MERTHFLNFGASADSRDTDQLSVELAWTLVDPNDADILGARAGPDWKRSGGVRALKGGKLLTHGNRQDIHHWIQRQDRARIL